MRYQVLPESAAERKALISRPQGAAGWGPLLGPHGGHVMAQTYDTIFRGGIVVSQDGEGARDVGVRDGRIAAIGDFSQSPE
jgi:hypothetical protein